jgi:hypothetical protein
MHGTGGTCFQGFAKEELNKRNHLEYLGIDGDNIKIVLKDIVWGIVEWNYLADDSHQWMAVWKKVMG